MTEPTNPQDPEHPEHRKPEEKFAQQGIQHTPIGARVPEDVRRGVFCNATMILQSNDEFVIDFLGTMVQPQQIMARVILTPTTFHQLIAALRENLGIYESHFGRLAARGPVPGFASIEDLYDQLKLSDKMLAGVYANMVMIRHMGEEFCLDFVANFYPRSIVTARIFMAAGRIPALLSAMSDAMAAYRQRLSGGGQQGAGEQPGE